MSKKKEESKFTEKKRDTQYRLTKFMSNQDTNKSSHVYINAQLVVKWAGGKRGLIEKYEPYFPRSFNCYFEPFFGGGAIFFHQFSNGKILKAKVSDINKELINMYEVVKTRVADLIEELKTGKYVNDKDSFYDIRAEEPDVPVLRAARLIYLNRTCFNGLYRVNKQGKFNVPFGKYPKNVKIFNEENLRNVNQCLQNVELTSEDFEKSVKDAKEGDFVYFDPPYMPLTDTAYFTDYTSEGFGIKEQERLAKVFKELDERGCYVMESNSDVPKIAELYEGFEIKKVHAKRFISSDPNGRGGVLESLIINY